MREGALGVKKYSLKLIIYRKRLHSARRKVRVPIQVKARRTRGDILSEGMGCRLQCTYLQARQSDNEMAAFCSLVVLPSSVTST